MNFHNVKQSFIVSSGVNERGQVKSDNNNSSPNNKHFIKPRTRQRSNEHVKLFFWRGWFVHDDEMEDVSVTKKYFVTSQTLFVNHCYSVSLCTQLLVGHLSTPPPAQAKKIKHDIKKVHTFRLLINCKVYHNHNLHRRNDEQMCIKWQWDRRLNDI